MTSPRLQQLKDALRVLASGAEAQINWLNEEMPVCVDELALEYDAIAVAADLMFGVGELDEDQRNRVAELNSILSKMSGKENAHLWTTDALRTAQEWRYVRTFAGECLKQLG